MAAIRATACSRRTGPGGRTESADRAMRRGLVDIALCSVMSDAGLRRSEASALLWADVDKAEDGSGRLTVRHSKTDKEGEGAVVAITVRAMADLEAMRNGAGSEEPVFGLSEQQINRRIKAAAQAAGLGDGFSGHSGRVGMARRMTSKRRPPARGHAPGALGVRAHAGAVRQERERRGGAGVPVRRGSADHDEFLLTFANRATVAP